MNSCECCFTDFLAKCETEIVINTNLTPGNTYRWVISDKFGHLYEGTAIAEDDGSLIIPIEDVPAGIFTQYSSDFNLQIYSENSCSPIKFKLTGEYDCVTFNIHGGTFVKNTIGCETTFELVEGGGAMVMGAVGAGDAEGGVITGNSLSLHKATETQPGLVGVDVTPQVFGGPKSFSGTVQFQNLTTFESIQKIILSAKPAAPPVGYGLIYPKADKRLYFLNSDDVEFDLGASGGIDDVLAEAQALTAGRVLEVGDANFFDISVNGIPFFEVIGGSKAVSLGPFVQVGDDEMNVKLNLTTDVGAELKYSFDNGVVQKEAKIVGFADATTATITHTADKHIFTGDEFVFLEGEEQLLWILPDIFQTKLMATNGDARSQVQLNSDPLGEIKIQLRSDDGSVNEAEIVLSGLNSTARYQAINGHEFASGDVTITALAGGGTTGLSIDNAGKIIRTP